ncbi:MAG: hypothetical protein IH945_03865 [Armatimonadetes bacterium]|nr:hypothetical protein [Armatimonadota bacterium]
MLAALILAAMVQGSRSVTFSHPCAHSSVVLEALGEELGLILRPSGSVNNDFFLVRFDGVDAETAFEKIAEYLNATWTQKEGVYYLGRTGAQDKSIAMRGRERLQNAVEEYLASAKRAKEWTRAMALAALRPHLLEDGRFDGRTATKALLEDGPFRELLDEFIRAVGSEKLTEPGQTRRTVYRWSPGGDERKIPGSVRQAAQRTITSVRAFRAAVRELGDPSAFPSTKPADISIGDVTGLSTNSFAFAVTDWGDNLMVQVVAAEGGLRPYDAFVHMTADTAPSQLSAIQSLDGVYRPSDLAKALAVRFRPWPDVFSNRLTERDDQFEEIIAWYESGFDTDPLQLFAGEAFLQAAEASGLNIVALLPDRLATSPVAGERDGSPLSTVIRELAYWTYLDVDDGWISVTPGSREGTDERFDRAAAARFALQSYEDGWQRIDPLAELANSCDGARAFSYARELSDLLQPTRRATRTIDPREVRLLKLYANLPAGARRQAKEGGVNWPIAQVPGPTRARLADAIAQSDLGRDRSDTSETMWPPMFGRGLGSVPFAASEIPIDASLEILFESARLFAMPDRKSGQSLSTPGLKTTDQLAETIYWTRKVLREGTARDGFVDPTGEIAIVDAERLVLRLHVPGGSPFYAIIAADSRGPGTRYVPYETLEGIETDAVRAAVKRREGGLFRSGSGAVVRR